MGRRAACDGLAGPPDAAGPGIEDLPGLRRSAPLDNVGTMKVLNLCCSRDHGFEGWFASEDDFQAQMSDGRLECPLCADRLISRRPSAPRLNLSGAREPAAAEPAARGPAGARAHAMADVPTRSVAAEVVPEALQVLWLQAVKQVMANTEDVGERFPEEVRRIHYGETEHRGIRGQATPEQRAELADEGIEVMALPLPAGLEGPLQ